MSYNGSGTFNINTAGQPVVTGTVISSTAFNALTADLGVGLSTALTKDGQTIATARIPFAQGINSSLVTDATSTTTGSIITAGGMGIAKALYVGTTANIAGTTTLAGVTATSVTDSGLTSGRVTYATTGGLLTDSAGLTFDGTMLSSAVARFGTYASFGTESLQVAKANGTGSVGSAYQFAINSKTANNRAEMIMTDGVSANAFISYAPSATTANDKLTFNLQGSDILTVVGNSRVGIGTTSPAYKLDVTASAGTIVNFTGGTPISIYSDTGNTSGVVSGNNGIYFSTSGNQISFTTNSTTQALLNSSGNLGLGVTPSAWGSSYKAQQIGQAGVISGHTAVPAMTLTSNAYENSGWKAITTNPAQRIDLSSDNNATIFYRAASATAGSALSWLESMRLDSSGNLLVGTTTASLGPTSGFNVIIGGGVTGTSIGHITGSSSGAYYELFAYNGSAIGSITQSGTTAVLFNVTSDQRLKENIQDADSASFLIDSLQVRKFDWKSDNSHQRYGFIAQELVTVAPEAVHQPIDSEEMMAVDYSKLVPMLVKEIQSLRARVAQLETKGV